jgi:hypothetical protein
MLTSLFMTAGSETAQLLEQTGSLAGSIKQNLAACRIDDNASLLARMRDNILTLINA